MKTAWICLVALIGVLALLAPAAGREPVQAGYKDATGKVVPYGLAAQRIVSLAPNLTEMVYYLGLGSHLSGRSDYCNYPREAAAVPSIGGFADASLERIVALKPDLVLAYQGNDREMVDQLRQLKIPVLAFNEAVTLAQIAEQMETLYKVASTPQAKAPAVLSVWRARLDQLTRKPAQRQPRVFFGYPGEMSVTCGPGSFLDDLLHCAGCSNVVTKQQQRWPMVSAEYVVAAKPDWMLSATSCTGGETAATKQSALLKQLRADPVWSKLAAVKSGQVCVMDADVLLRPGPRVLDALAQFEARLQAESGGA